MSLLDRFVFLGRHAERSRPKSTPETRLGRGPSGEPVLAIIAPVRDEAASLIEWIAYHRAQGIDTFILGDNGGEDTTSDLVIRLDRAGIVHRLDWRGKRYFQLAFLEEAMAKARVIADGAFLIDADEYLRPLHETVSVRKLASAWLGNEQISAVAINWAIYGSSGRTEPGSGLVIERFTWRANQNELSNLHVKSFVRTADWAGMEGNAHAVKVRRGRYVDTALDELQWNTSVTPTGLTRAVVWNGLRIDHFVVKSRAEFDKKRRRGSPDSPEGDSEARWRHFFERHDRNEVEDAMPKALVTMTRQEMAQILTKIGEPAAETGSNDRLGGDTVTLASPPVLVQGHVDSVAVMNGLLRIFGWARRGARPVLELIKVRLGQDYLMIDYRNRLDRPDVVKAFSDSPLDCGFEIFVRLTDINPEVLEKDGIAVLVNAAGRDSHLHFSNDINLSAVASKLRTRTT